MRLFNNYNYNARRLVSRGGAAGAKNLANLSFYVPRELAGVEHLREKYNFCQVGVTVTETTALQQVQVYYGITELKFLINASGGGLCAHTDTHTQTHART